MDGGYSYFSWRTNNQGHCRVIPIKPERMARIIVAKLGIVGCTVGAWVSYNGEFNAQVLSFTALALCALILLVSEVMNGDDDDNDDSRPPDLRFRH